MKTLARVLFIGLGALFGLIILLLIIVRLSIGRGEDYEDLSSEALLSESELEIVATMDMPLGNPAVSADGRIFFNLHPLAEPEGATVFEWLDGQALPYPDKDFQSNFRSVLGMFIDGQNRLWTLDNSSLSSGNTRLLAFDLGSNEIVHDHTFGDDFDFLNDLQVSPDGRTIFFSDPGLFFLSPPAIVVYDLESGETRRLLEGHDSVTAQNWNVQADEGTLWLVPGLLPFRLGIDGLALSKDGQWLYYGGITHDTLFRLRTEDLLNKSISDEALADRIERVGQKPLSDGLSADVEDNIYITDVEHQGIARMAPDGQLQTLIRDERVRWADGLSFGPDGLVYFTDSAIPYIFGSLPTASPASIEANGPYHLFRFQSDVVGVPGG
jgi:sugar lactone lactonase YvrE